MHDILYKYFYVGYSSLELPRCLCDKEHACQCRRGETRDQSLNWEGPLEKEMATHSSILAWKIPWTEEPGGLQSLRTCTCVHTHTHTCSHSSQDFSHIILSLGVFRNFWLNAGHFICLFFFSPETLFCFKNFNPTKK